MIWVKPFINGTLRISLSLSYLVDQQKDTWYTLNEASNATAQPGCWIGEQVRKGEVKH